MTDTAKSARRFGKEAIFATIDKALPDKAVCDALLQSYMRNVHWTHHVRTVPLR